MGEVEERDRPLSVRFQDKAFRPALRAALGIGDNACAIVIDLAVSGPCSYSRTAGHYDAPKRYRNKAYTFRKIVGAVDQLDALGLIDHDRRPPGIRGWQSRMAGREEMVRITREIIGTERLRLRPHAEVIILRDPDGRPIDYRDTRGTDRQRGRLKRFNEALEDAALPPEILAPVARIYNQDFSRGGRIYAQGPSWQNLPEAARRQISIGGEPVEEVDYRTLHPFMLYAEVGHRPPADCYAVDPWPRDVVKLALLKLINAPSENTARLSIAHNEFAELPLQQATGQAARLIRDIKRAHAPIARFFHSDAGAWLMRRDSDLAEAVLMKLLDRGVVALPVHDSFLVPRSQRGLLEQVMADAAATHGLVGIEVEVKQDRGGSLPLPSAA